MLRRLGPGGLAVVLAAFLYGCSAGAPGTPSEAAAPAASVEREGPAPQSAADGAGSAPAVPPAEAGRPAVVEDDGTGEEQRATARTVALDEPARPAEELEITVASTEPVEAEGMGPGGRSGPAVAVVVSVRNTSGAAVSTLGSSITVTYGAEDRPADLSPQPGDQRLPDRVEPGKTVSGTYTFLVPQDRRDDVVITASYRATDPAAVFTGPAAGDGAAR